MKTKGFTLVEMMLVLAVLLGFVTLLYPVVSHALKIQEVKNKGRETIKALVTTREKAVVSGEKQTVVVAHRSFTFYPNRKLDGPKVITIETEQYKVDVHIDDFRHRIKLGQPHRLPHRLDEDFE